MPSRLTGEQQARLEALRRAYLKELPAKVRAIENAAASLGAGGPEKLRSLYHLVHRLAGSAAIYGIHGLGRAAAALEEAVLAACEGTAPMPLEKDPALASRLAALKAELEVALRPDLR